MKIIFLFIFYNFLVLNTVEGQTKENHSTELIYTFVYEIYDIRFCHLTPNPFLCEKCIKMDMQIGKKIIFREKEIIRIHTCIPYKKKYLY